MIEIEVRGTKATIEDEQWKTDDPMLLGILNLCTKAYNSLPQPYTPDRDYTIASRVCDVMDGRITHHDKQDYDPDVIY
jgi:hypothetical protein